MTLFSIAHVKQALHMSLSALIIEACVFGSGRRHPKMDVQTSATIFILFHVENLVSRPVYERSYAY